ncbi:MAG: aminopeptidase [Clostridia bacterium]|nr:aminopeptidase [Clostridia bacterium]
MSEETKSTLTYSKKTVWETASSEEIEKAYAYAEGYRTFIDRCKTERESVIEGIRMVEKAGFVPFQFGDNLKAGGRYYYNNRGKNLFAFVIGTEPLSEGVRITGAHIDSPRLDLKQIPLYEDSGLAYLKTHYYGGIRKYQWPTIPLALHGVVVRADGTTVEVCIGEDESDPILYITDLLPHLASADNAKPLGTAVPAEKLNLVIGTRPLSPEGDSQIRENVLRLLNEKYRIDESDFMSAELCAVPAYKSRDVGLDRSLIAAYGHDDRVCAYPALTGLLEAAEESKHTMLCILADKEETGSDGPSGMQCDLLVDLLDEIARYGNISPAALRCASKCVSSDVSACLDPNFADVFEKNNACLLGCGVTMNKYTGSGGKYGTNDATAEYVGFIRRAMAAYHVVWQTAELGRVDAGGGGTIAKFVSHHNIDTIDMGVGVLSMHAPCEIISKVDLYEAHKAFKAFNCF